MWLDIRVVGTEQLLSSFDREHLNLVYVFAAAVIAFMRIALGILICEHATLGLHNPRTCVVLGSDQFYMLFLPKRFRFYGFRHFVIKACNRFVAYKHYRFTQLGF